MSPMFIVFAAIRQIVDDRASAGIHATTRQEMTEALVEIPLVHSLAFEVSASHRTYNTPERWLGKVHDWFTGQWWGRTEWHAGLSKRPDGTWTVLSPQWSERDAIGSVALVMDWYADATAADPLIAAAPVDASAAHRLAPSLWQLFVDNTDDLQLASVTNAGFVGWASHYLLHSTDTWTTHGQRR